VVSTKSIHVQKFVRTQNEKAIAFQRVGAAGRSGRAQPLRPEVDLGLSGGTTQSESVQVADTALSVRRCFTQYPRCQGFGRSTHERIVEEKESLWSNDGLPALCDNQAGVGTVK
jgi:hypothetical protein